ncbi:MAG: periplasmic heavy metal sensor [Gemmatimonadetes bacterium]|nr:periplasmic heavy metal sensor [Gemmatimonadota bacterium]
MRSRQTASMFLLGALLTGGVLGFSANRVFAGGHGKPWTDPQKTARAQLADRLDLTPAQRERVDSILDDRHRQMTEVLKPVRPRMDSIRLNARAQIRRILTPAQEVEFEAVLKEMQADSGKGGRR